MTLPLDGVGIAAGNIRDFHGANLALILRSQSVIRGLVSSGLPWWISPSGRLVGVISEFGCTGSCVVWSVKTEDSSSRVHRVQGERCERL